LYRYSTTDNFEDDSEDDEDEDMPLNRWGAVQAESSCDPWLESAWPGSIPGAYMK
jgi:hypothetical protein